MKILILLITFVAVPFTSINATPPIYSSYLAVQEDLVSADIKGPHRYIAHNKIGLINGSVRQAYKAQYQGCVIRFHSTEDAVLRRGEELRILSQNIRRDHRENCLEWDTDMGGDDICLEYGKPIPTGMLVMELQSKLTGRSMSLTCAADTHNATAFFILKDRSLGRIILPEL